MEDSLTAAQLEELRRIDTCTVSNAIETFGVRVRNDIDRTGKLVIPPQFDDAKRFHGRFAVVSKRGKWSWIGKAGRTVAESEIDLIP